VSDKYSELEDFSLTKELISSCRDHGGLVISISYILITLTGILYLYTFFTVKFDIPVLSFITIEDALVMGVREPLIIAIFLGAVLFQLTTDACLRWQAKKIQTIEITENSSIFTKMKRYLLWVPKKSSSIIAGYLAFLLVFNIAVHELAEYNAEKILAGEKGEHNNHA